MLPALARHFRNLQSKALHWTDTSLWPSSSPLHRIVLTRLRLVYAVHLSPTTLLLCLVTFGDWMTIGCVNSPVPWHQPLNLVRKVFPYSFKHLYYSRSPGVKGYLVGDLSGMWAVFDRVTLFNRSTGEHAVHRISRGLFSTQLCVRENHEMH